MSKIGQLYLSKVQDDMGEDLAPDLVMPYDPRDELLAAIAENEMEKAMRARDIEQALSDATLDQIIDEYNKRIGIL